MGSSRSEWRPLTGPCCYAALSRMGHGDHWRCIFEDLQAGIREVPGWIQEGALVGQREYRALPVPDADEGATVSVIAWPSEGLAAIFVIVRPKKTGRAYLHTAFPAARGGCNHRIRVGSVGEISCGLEARISGWIGDAAVTFFDPLYSVNRDRYRDGALADVQMSAIAYSLGRVPCATELRTAAGDVLVEGAAILLPVRRNDEASRASTPGEEEAFGLAYIQEPDTFPLPDDYQFCAPVRNVKESEIGGILVWKFRSTVMRMQDGSQEIDIDVYCTRQGLRDDAPPVAGDTIWGTLWLQGTLAG